MKDDNENIELESFQHLITAEIFLLHAKLDLLLKLTAQKQAKNYKTSFQEQQQKLDAEIKRLATYYMDDFYAKTKHEQKYFTTIHVTSVNELNEPTKYNVTKRKRRSSYTQQNEKTDEP